MTDDRIGWMSTTTSNTNTNVHHHTFPITPNALPKTQDNGRERAGKYEERKQQLAASKKKAPSQTQTAMNHDMFKNSTRG